jgi:cyclic beta-1,2-glucan synthetase
VLAGDIYSQGDNRGRGGWSWYTGAAAWAWRGAIEAVFGLKRRADKLMIDPCLPPAWDRCRATLRTGDSSYVIEYHRVEAAEPGVRIELDGRPVSGNLIDFHDDGNVHRVTVAVNTP